MADVPHPRESKRKISQARKQDAENVDVQTTNRITGNRRWWALAAVLITIFFGSLDQTVVSTAMPVIVGDLKGFDIYAWVFTAYLMTSTITVPIYGKLSDVYGRKPFYIFGLIVFIIGSALSGQSHSMLELIIFRGLQGIGAGAMLSMPRATIGDIFTPRERGRWMGVISMTFGLSSIIGPYLGGWITDQLGWPWIFYINLPVAFLALLGTLYALPRVRAEKDVHVDWTGSTLLVAGLVPLLLAFTWAGNQYAWGSTQIIGLLAFSVVVLALFAWVETRVEEPIIPTDFFKIPIFTTANLVGFLISIGMFGTLLFLPLYVQGVLGFSAQNSGAIMTPMMGSFIVAALVAGQLMTRSGKYKMISVAAAIIMSGGLYLFTRLGANSNFTSVIIDMVVLGIGIGALLPILNVAVQNAFPYRDMGIVNAAQQFVRSLGAVIATPILGTVLANKFSAQMKLNLPSTLQQAMNNLPPAVQQVLSDPQSLTNAQTQAAIKSKFDVFGANGTQLYHQFINTVHQSLASGIQQLFWIALFFSLAALLATLFLPEIPLQQEEFFEDGEDLKEHEPGSKPSHNQ
jgi:EmrB/QacA subfamily drug resistance transporter